MTNWIVIPEEFRDGGNGYCSTCKVEHGQCGHFLDSRDTYGPFATMNWMIDGLPWGGPRETYHEWVRSHYAQIRTVQEHPNSQIFVLDPAESDHMRLDWLQPTEA